MKASAAALLHNAAQVIQDRGATHGSKYENHAKIAAVWNGILDAAGKTPAKPLDAHDVATLMEGLKIARRFTGAFNDDDYLDAAGYAACAFEIRAHVLDSWAKAAPPPEDDGA
jgi:hypothetical protein